MIERHIQKEVFQPWSKDDPEIEAMSKTVFLLGQQVEALESQIEDLKKELKPIKENLANEEAHQRRGKSMGIVDVTEKIDLAKGLVASFVTETGEALPDRKATEEDKQPVLGDKEVKK